MRPVQRVAPRVCVRRHVQAMRFVRLDIVPLGRAVCYKLVASSTDMTGVGRARCAMVAMLVWLGASSGAPTAEQVDTGSQCVTALHEETENAGPLPSRLISLLSPKGQRLLDGGTPCRNYPAIAASFTTQVTPAFCGLASSITELNTSNAPKPPPHPRNPS